MEKEALYSIGEVSKICDVSPRMLRYYEQIGLITPEKIDDSSHYRYYSIQNMRLVHVIRYLIDAGFRLEEIRELLFKEDLDRFQDLFLKQVDETREKIEYYHQRLDSLKNWYALLVEGRWVHRKQSSAITIKYIPENRYFYCERNREPGERDSEAHLEIEYFTMSKQGGHSMVDVGGAFHVKFDSYRERMEDSYRKHTMLQTLYPNSKSYDNTILFGGFLAISAYHIGKLEQISETYERVLNWAERHAFVLRGDCYERYVLDIYSAAKEENYVTELVLPLQENAEDFDCLSQWNINVL